MQEEEKIKCPKCGSTQLSANKKGWSLGTGAIGMNKVLITCLKCGKKFRPGEDMEAQQKKKEEQAKAMKKPGFWIFFIILISLFVWGLKSCFSTSTPENTTVIATSDSNQTTVQQIPDSISRYYQVLATQHDAVHDEYILLVLNNSKIEEINDFFKNYYNKNRNNWLDIRYVDNKKDAENYLDKNIAHVSDKELDFIDKHTIAVYSFNPTNKYEDFHFNHKK
jgi:DNA-directed RNA polymerase subunit RPC12/RpoP